MNKDMLQVLYLHYIMNKDIIEVLYLHYIMNKDILESVILTLYHKQRYFFRISVC